MVTKTEVIRDVEKERIDIIYIFLRRSILINQMNKGDMINMAMMKGILGLGIFRKVKIRAPNMARGTDPARITYENRIGIKPEIGIGLILGIGC